MPKKEDCTENLGALHGSSESCQETTREQVLPTRLSDSPSVAGMAEHFHVRQFSEMKSEQFVTRLDVTRDMNQVAATATGKQRKDVFLQWVKRRLLIWKVQAMIRRNKFRMRCLECRMFLLKCSHCLELRLLRLKYKFLNAKYFFTYRNDVFTQTPVRSQRIELLCKFNEFFCGVREDRGSSTNNDRHGNPLSTNVGHNPVAEVDVDVIKGAIGDLGSWLGSTLAITQFEEKTMSENKDATENLGSSHGYAFFWDDRGIDLDSVSDSPENVRLAVLSAAMGWRFDYPDRYDLDEAWKNILTYGKVVCVSVAVLKA